MQNRHLEPTNLAELGVDVQRVPVTGQTVDGSLLFGRLLLDYGVGCALWGLVDSRRSASVSTLGVTTEPTRSSDKNGTLVVEDVLASVGVLSGGSLYNHTSSALIHDLDQFGISYELSLGGNGVFPDLEELLAVQEHHRGEVGNDIVEVVRGNGVELRNHTKSGIDLEILVVFENEGEVSSLCADAEVCDVLDFEYSGYQHESDALL